MIPWLESRLRISVEKWFCPQFSGFSSRTKCGSMKGHVMLVNDNLIKKKMKKRTLTGPLELCTTLTLQLTSMILEIWCTNWSHFCPIFLSLFLITVCFYSLLFLLDLIVKINKILTFTKIILSLSCLLRAHVILTQHWTLLTGLSAEMGSSLRGPSKSQSARRYSTYIAQYYSWNCWEICHWNTNKTSETAFEEFLFEKTRIWF